jgi:lycopene beta-cyclase
MATAVLQTFDYVLVGGGLGNALIALALLEAQPQARVALVEQAHAIGGNHLWCFHAGDVDEGARSLVAPLIGASWPRYEVQFPELTRTLDEPYVAVRSERLDEVVRERFLARRGARLFLAQRAVRVSDHGVMLDNGQELTAHTVIESRGPDALSTGARAGYQKFLGLELKLRRPCPIRHPLLMDARVPQSDGFRFLYALPLAEDRVLLEDTYFSDSEELSRERLEAEILSYAERHGFAVDYVAREEVGVLPLPTRLPRVANPQPGGPLVAGYQGAWFHPVTGYSFPLAVRVASAVASTSHQQLRAEVWPRLVRAQRSQLRFCLLLNKLFFGAFAPEERRNVIERFYRLPAESVRRFYAMNLTAGDRARILCGRPPRGFSLGRALSLSGGENAPPSVRPTPGGALS